MTGLSGVIGKTCPYCQTPIKPGEAVVFCSACSIPHHRECWNEGEDVPLLAVTAIPLPNHQIGTAEILLILI